MLKIFKISICALLFAGLLFSYALVTIQADDIINDTPIESDEIFYGLAYRSLPEDLRQLYSSVHLGISQKKREFTVRAANGSDIGVVIGAILKDCPEFFWIDGTAQMTGFEILGIWRITLGFNIDSNEIDGIRNEIEQRAGEYLESLPEGAGDYTKTKLAYEYVIRNTDYEIGSYQNQNIQSVFLYGKSVCAGYSRAFQYLLQKAGVRCDYIEGTIDSSSSDAGHAWNLININGVDTFVDVSWGDPTYGENETDSNHLDMVYDYLCLTGSEMRRTGHICDDGELIPECEDNTFDYYRLNDIYYYSCDRDVLSRAIWNAVDEAQSFVTFKFADYDTYLEAKDLLFSGYEGNILEAPLRQRMEWDERSSMSYYYSCHDELRIIKIYW